MSRIKGKVVNVTRLVQGGEIDSVVGASLRNLRTLAGLTQKELAARLNVGQAAVSKIESRGNVQVSSLQKYVEALGAAAKPASWTALPYIPMSLSTMMREAGQGP